MNRGPAPDQDTGIFPMAAATPGMREASVAYLVSDEGQALGPVRVADFRAIWDAAWHAGQRYLREHETPPVALEHPEGDGEVQG